MINSVPLNIYGIRINHPVDWQVFVNPNSKFTFDEGLIKVDKVKGSQKAKASLSIRWAKMVDDITLDEYVEELEKQFKWKEKRSRRKDRYKIVSKSKIQMNGTEGCLLENEFVANHSIYRIFGKDELVKVLQVFFYSKETKRMVVASMSMSPEELKRNRDQFVEILTTLHEDLNTGRTDYHPLQLAY